MYSNIQEKAKEIRGNTSQWALSQDWGVSQSLISQYENGKVKSEKLDKLYKELEKEEQKAEMKRLSNEIKRLKKEADKKYNKLVAAEKRGEIEDVGPAAREYEYQKITSDDFKVTGLTELERQGIANDLKSFINDKFSNVEDVKEYEKTQQTINDSEFWAVFRIVRKEPGKFGFNKKSKYLSEEIQDAIDNADSYRKEQNEAYDRDLILKYIMERKQASKIDEDNFGQFWR